MTSIGINMEVGGKSSVKSNGRLVAPKGGRFVPDLTVAKVESKAVTPAKVESTKENAKAVALKAFVNGLGAFHKASVSCRVLVLAAVEAGCTRDEMIEAGEEAGFERDWVGTVVRTEAGLRERAERSDKGSAKNPHAKKVLAFALELTEKDMKEAASALLAAYKLAKKALAK